MPKLHSTLCETRNFMTYRNNTLFIIPARGGSKGIPRKNIKPLRGKPLIHYSIEVARALSPDSHIIVSTDDDEIPHIFAFQVISPIRPPGLPAETADRRIFAYFPFRLTLFFYINHPICPFSIKCFFMRNKKYCTSKFH